MESTITVVAISPLVGMEGLVGIMIMTDKSEMVLLKGPAVGMLLDMGNPAPIKRRHRAASDSKPPSNGHSKPDTLWQKPTRCLICNKAFSSRGGAYTHIRNVHKKKPTDKLVEIA